MNEHLYRQAVEPPKNLPLPPVDPKLLREYDYIYSRLS